MPGLLGIATTGLAEDAEARFRTACGRMLRHGGMTTDVTRSADGRCLLGNVRRTRVLSQTAREQETSALVHGVVYEPGVEDRGADDIAVQLARRCIAGDVGFIDGMRGEFCLAVLDDRRGRVLVATDALGSHPLYWRVDGDGLIFSSDLSALLKATPAAASLDLRAVADYVTIGAVLGNKTLAAGVQVLDPGTVLSYDLSTGTVSQHRYFEVASLFSPGARPSAEYMSTVRERFAAAVDRAMGGNGQIGLSLSGGLDSRAVLSAVNGRAGLVRTYTLGVDGCADQLIAERLAAIAGSQHTFFALDSSYLRDFLPNMAAMVSATDGMYLSHGLTEMLAIHFLDRTGIEILLRGHGGELAKAHLAWPLHTDSRVYQMRLASELVPYLAARANYITPDVPLSRFLAPDAAQAAGRGSEESFAAALAATTMSPAQCCSYLYLRELNRRFTVPSLELFRTRVEVRLPFLDRDFLAVLLAAPPEWRDGTAIHQAITASGLPKLLKVRNSNTGAPADAGPLSEFVLDKVNSVLKRLNVRGYRHYHDFDAWMRSMLLESVEAELASPQARVQTFLTRNAVNDLMRETREGIADRAYLLQILLILELWMRENGVQTAA